MNNDVKQRFVLVTDTQNKQMIIRAENIESVEDNGPHRTIKFIDGSKRQVMTEIKDFVSQIMRD